MAATAKPFFGQFGEPALDEVEPLTEGIGLSDHEREKISSGNAIKLLKLEGRI